MPRRIATIVAILYILAALALSALAPLRDMLGSISLPTPVPGQPVVIKVLYSSEKRLWLEAALERFRASKPKANGRLIQIELQTSGSRDLVEAALDGKTQPSVLIPASNTQIEHYRRVWQTKNRTAPFIDEPRSLVLTPLVVIGWNERSSKLFPNGQVGADFWQRLQGLFSSAQGWQSAGGEVSWGLAKFGQTSPKQSNSGLQALVLMAYAFAQKTDNLTPDDITQETFAPWLDAFECSVQQFGANTGDYTANMIRVGPSQYDFVITYENLAAEYAPIAKQRRSAGLHIYYPPTTLINDNPYAILSAPWIDSDQQAAARTLRDFLLSDEAQRLALLHGFRPANSAITLGLDDPGNPFRNAVQQEAGLQTDLPPQVAAPSQDVMDSLLKLWQDRDYANRRPSC